MIEMYKIVTGKYHPNVALDKGKEVCMNWRK